jgi:hypothetical protein
MRRSKDDSVVAAQPIGSAAGGSGSVESTRPGVKRSLQRLYAAEAAQSTNRKATPVTVTTPANERRQSGAYGEPANENRESGASPANESSTASVLSQKMREELRERARKINSLVFKAKTCSTSTVVQPSSSPGPSMSLDVSSNSPAVGSLSSNLASTSSCQQKEKKKKRRKDKKFEGTRVPHLTKVRPYRPPAELPSPEAGDEESEDSKQERKKTTDAAAAQDDYVLAKLFAKSGGVHSALRHDAIVDDDAADHALLEAEAAQAAKAAVRALRDSRRHYAPTSSAGSSSRFGKKKKTSLGNSNQLMTSADLLARIRARNKVVVTAAAVAVGGPEREEEGEESLFFPTTATTTAGGGGGGEEGLGAQQSELLTDIRNFIAFQVRKKSRKCSVVEPEPQLFAFAEPEPECTQVPVRPEP